MRKHILLAAVAVVTTTALAAAPTTAPAGTPAAAGAATRRSAPTLVDVRAGHHPGYDRVVFEFRGGLPAERSMEYVDQLITDPQGIPLWIAGDAVLAVRFFPAQAHTSAGAPTTSGRIGFDTPNVVQVTRSGDFEAVLSHGIGLARRGTARMFTLTDPARVVIDVTTTFRTVPAKVYLVDQTRVQTGQEPYAVAVRRPVIPPATARGALLRLFGGPTTAERAAGLTLVRSRATGFADLSITDQVARVRLTGGCDSGGSTVTVANEIVPTLKQFPSVRWVKIYDPAGRTGRPTGRSDSIPACLEP
jgi:hypothetical protein